MSRRGAEFELANIFFWISVDEIYSFKVKRAKFTETPSTKINENKISSDLSGFLCAKHVRGSRPESGFYSHFG
jgi:hypothetical protein